MRDPVKRISTTFSTFNVLAKAKELESQGEKIIHFEIGEPDFTTPENISNAAYKAIKEGFTHYVPSQGIPELREAIAEHESKFKGIEVTPDRVVVTSGAKAMILYAIFSVIQPGEEVLYPNPGYLSYKPLIELPGGSPVPYRLIEEEGFKIDLEEMERKISPKTRAIIINSPHNPTGVIHSSSELESIADLSEKYSLYVIADEIYSRIIYEGEHISIASLPGMLQRTILVDGFSKTYAMTGWRLGYGVVPKDFVKPIVSLIQNSVSCATSFVQKAGVEALRGPQESVLRMVETFRARREIILKAFDKMSEVKVFAPKGAFYVFPKVNIPKPVDEIVDQLLKEYGVSLLPGMAFGDTGTGHLRLSYATSTEDVKEGMQRIKEAFEKLSF